MAEDKVKLPKWILALLITIGSVLFGTIMSLVVYIHERDIVALNENTAATKALTATMKQNTWLDSLQQEDIQDIKEDLKEIKKAVGK
jgi:hypothetical protein